MQCLDSRRADWATFCRTRLPLPSLGCPHKIVSFFVERADRRECGDINPAGQSSTIVLCCGRV
eukprot:4471474-Pyramimonas_sp.AAC.1